ncbi:AAA family ATPase [uncultured Limosilactobacillus sp.]|uniref:AAA family ATPase n=1 Tax=uncultured Limosilactobacillus sp. TaxID=2837629 RepID=UPI0025DC2AAE|nr:AAA family ATPase [uncultured Limosilactobacillus sp.]
MALSYQLMKQAVKVVLAAGNVPNVVGEAGIGKSALVREVATELKAKLFTTVVSLSEKGDLAIPVPPLHDEAFIKTTHYGILANVQYGYSETLIQIIQQAESHPNQRIIWFLDEFNRGTAAVQAELMNLVLQRQVNSLRLPQQVQIVIAENPDPTMTHFTGDNYSVTPADDAIKDRTVRLEMKASLADWLQWAQQQDLNGQPHIHPLVQQYLQEHSAYLNGPQNDDLYPTPRSWTRVSKNLVKLTSLDQRDRSAIIADLFSGDLGIEVGTAFADYVLHQERRLTVQDLVSDDHLEEFNQLSEADKVTLLIRMIKKYPSQMVDEKYLRRLMQYLVTVSADGQYAVIRQFAQLTHQNPEILSQLYRQANAGQNVAKNFYQLLQKVVVK